jgi:hypothetical protein
MESETKEPTYRLKWHDLLDRAEVVDASSIYLEDDRFVRWNRFKASVEASTTFSELHHTVSTAFARTDKGGYLQQVDLLYQFSTVADGLVKMCFKDDTLTVPRFPYPTPPEDTLARNCLILLLDEQYIDTIEEVIRPLLPNVLQVVFRNHFFLRQILCRSMEKPRVIRYILPLLPSTYEPRIRQPPPVRRPGERHLRIMGEVLPIDTIERLVHTVENDVALTECEAVVIDWLAVRMKTYSFYIPQWIGHFVVHVLKRHVDLWQHLNFICPVYKRKRAL